MYLTPLYVLIGRKKTSHTAKTLGASILNWLENDSYYNLEM
jgi:hypothetical protein